MRTTPNVRAPTFFLPPIFRSHLPGRSWSQNNSSMFKLWNLTGLALLLPASRARLETFTAEILVPFTSIVAQLQQ